MINLTKGLMDCYGMKRYMVKKWHWYISGFLICFLFFGGQSKPCFFELKPQVLLDAEAMLNAMQTGDLKTMMKYIYPPVMEMNGGRRKYLAGLKQEREEHLKRGDAFVKMEVSNPSVHLECNGELQCVFLQKTTMSISGQDPFIISSNLIGFSRDKGKKWTFLNVQDKKLGEVRLVYPNVCDGLPFNTW